MGLTYLHIIKRLLRATNLGEQYFDFKYNEYNGNIS